MPRTKIVDRFGRLGASACDIVRLTYKDYLINQGGIGRSWGTGLDKKSIRIHPRSIAVIRILKGPLQGQKAKWFVRRQLQGGVTPKIVLMSANSKREIDAIGLVTVFKVLQSRCLNCDTVIAKDFGLPKRP